MSTAAAPLGSVNGQWDEERTARACLSGVVDPARPDLAKLITQVGAPRVWQTLRQSSEDSVWATRARSFDLGRSLGLLERDDVRFLIPGDPDWITGWDDLASIDHGRLGGVPLGMWAVGAGSPGELLAQSVAMVGSRASTGYGERVSTDLAAELAAAGFTVVSGGAYGIDAACHRGALTVAGATIAILAGGLDQWYPRGNSRLFEQMSQSSVVISEVAPGVRPTKAGFLARNRLLAAGSQATVIVEAALRSGALNTTGWAAELFRPVFAVPGPVTSAASMGPHSLVRGGGAVLVTTAAEVISGLRPIEPDPPGLPRQPRLLDDLDPHEVVVREALPGRGSLDVGQLAERTGLRVPLVLAALGSLEHQQLVRRRPDGTWSLARPERN